MNGKPALKAIALLLGYAAALAMFAPIGHSLCNILIECALSCRAAPYLPPHVVPIIKGMQWLLLVLSIAVFLPFFRGKAKSPPREIAIGDMSFSETALYTNIMITGAIGSGKTSSAIYPILDQICRQYNVPDEKTSQDDPRKKFGGLVMDVKGDFYEALVCMMHWAGRNVLEDLVVITPWADYEYAEMEDPETGKKWYVSMRGGPGANSNEFTLLCKGLTMPGSTRPIPINYFTEYDKMDMPMPGTGMTRGKWLQSLEFTPSKDTGFLGWRPAKGGQLMRITHTNRDLREVPFRDKDKSFVLSDPPKKLRFIRPRFINNGLTFNIAPPSLGHVELANRLVAMSKNASGKKGGSSESGSYFDDATRKHIQWVIFLLRTIHPGMEVTATDISRHTVSESTISKSTDILSQHIRRLKAKRDKLGDPADIARIDAEIDILNDMGNYFSEEWAKLDSRTKSNLVSTITNVFVQFLSDPRLRSTFCTTTAVKIDEVMQSGKVFTLVAPEYESAARVFGTSLKMEFQAILRRRTACAEYDKSRFILFMGDEIQNFVTAGGNDPTSGDESFMALSRQSKVCNVVATQADSSIINVIGEQCAEVYYAQFGSRLWYQNSDEKTNKRASSILGKVKRKKVSTSGQDVTVPGLFAKENSQKGYSENVSYESKERYGPDIFPNLDVHQCVIYNKTKKGKNNKSCKCRLKPHFIGDPAPERQDEKNRVLRWYFRAYIENRLYETGAFERLDNVQNIPETADNTPKDAENGQLAKNSEEQKSGTYEEIPAEIPKDEFLEFVGEVLPGSFLEERATKTPEYAQSLLDVFEIIAEGATPPGKKSNTHPRTELSEKLDALASTLRFIDKKDKAAQSSKTGAENMMAYKRKRHIGDMKEYSISESDRKKLAQSSRTNFKPPASPRNIYTNRIKHGR